jgi:hypothetical protein
MTHPGSRRALLAAGGLTMVGLSGYAVYRGMGTQSPSSRRSQAVKRAEVERHVAESTARANQAAAARSAEFEAFIRERKAAGLVGFSKDVTSYKSSWLAIKDRLRFTDANEHRQFVADAFGRRLFTPAQLSERVARIVKSFEQDLLEEQNKLAVQVRQTLDGAPVPPSEASEAHRDMARAVAVAAGAAESAATTQVGNLVVSEAVSTIASQVLVRLGVTAGILSAGAATSWWTLGAGVAIGFAVDAAVRYFKNPEENVKRDVERALDEFAVKVKDSIRQELEQAVGKRAAAWHQAATGML